MGAGSAGGGGRIVWLGSFLSDRNQGEMPVNAGRRFSKQRQNSVSSRNKLSKLAQPATTSASPSPRPVQGVCLPPPGPSTFARALMGFQSSLLRGDFCKIDCTV